MQDRHDAWTRRELLKRGAAGAAVAAGGGFAAPEAARAEPPAAGRFTGSRDLALVNGTFVDEHGVVASALTIQDGRIVEVGRARALGPSAHTINLHGRTVIPGLIDSHAHFLRTGTNPGHEARGIEAAFSIAELQEVVARRAESVPEGQFITCSGGWNRLQLAERRLPNKAELDAAAPRRPVYLQAGGGGGGGVTNSLGEAFFEARGVAVDEVTGAVASTGAATTALRSTQTPEDKLRGTRDLMAHAAGLGLTMIHDTGNLTVQPDDYRFVLELYNQQARQLAVRMRPYRWFGPGTTPSDLEAYIKANFNQIGNDVLRLQGVGENIVGDAADFEDGCRVVARNGWTLTRHTLSATEHVSQVAAVKKVGSEFAIADLRWSLAHVTLITEAQLQDLISVGAGVTVQDFPYLGTGAGPPYRRIVDSGIRVGGGTDSTNVSPLNPWLALFHMTTGRNLAGDVTNAGQTLSRLEALRLYTVGSAWFSREDDEVGTFEAGKVADLAVLSDDYLTVPTDRLRKVSSHLTVQGGRIVHASGPFAGLT